MFLIRQEVLQQAEHLALVSSCFPEGLQSCYSWRSSGLVFAAIGIPYPDVMGPFVGVFEIVCRALITTASGTWHKARADFTMLLVCLYLLIEGAVAGRSTPRWPIAPWVRLSYGRHFPFATVSANKETSMSDSLDAHRRLLVTAGVASVGLLAATDAGVVLAAETAWQEKDEEKEVSAVEDLMREHGVLRRALLVYRESTTKLRGDPASIDPN